MKNSKSFSQIFADYANGRYPLAIVRLKQRRYEWTRSNVQDFLDGIDDVIVNKPSYGFNVHAIAIFENTEKGIEELIDGNQRTTTTLLCYLALKNFITNCNLCDAYSDIINDINFRLYSHQNEGEFIFEPLIEDKSVFSDIINNSDILSLNTQNYDGGKLPMYKAYKQIYSHINEKVVNNELYIREFYYFGINNIRTLVQELESEQEAAHFFNSQDKGKKLSDATKFISNLHTILNDFLCYEEIEEYYRYADKLNFIKDSITNDKSFFSYYYYYLTDSFEKRNRVENRLQSYIENVIDGKKNDKHFSNILELIDNLEYFVNLRRQIKQRWFDNETHQFNKFYNICDDSISIQYTIVDIESDKFDYEFSYREKKNILEMIMTCNIRSTFLIIGHTYHPEQQICGLISKCLNKQKETDERIDVIYKNILINERRADALGYLSDDNFEKNIPIKKVYGGNKARLKYIFICLNNYKLDEPQPIFVKGSNSTIEHIIPQSGNDKQPLLNTIGNLTVLDGSFNSKLKDREYKDKKGEYKKSWINLNRYFDDKDEFTWEDVEERTKILAKQMVEIFKIK